MSLPLDNFDIKTDENFTVSFNILCAEKLNEYSDASIQQRKIYYDYCLSKLNSIVTSFPQFQKSIKSKNNYL